MWRLFSFILCLSLSAIAQSNTYPFMARELASAEEIQLFQRMQALSLELKSKLKISIKESNNNEEIKKLEEHIAKINSNLFKLFGYQDSLKYTLILNKASVINQEKKTVLKLNSAQEVNSFRKAINTLKSLKKSAPESKEFHQERALFQQKYKLDPALHYIMISERAKLYLILSEEDMRKLI